MHVYKFEGNADVFAKEGVPLDTQNKNGTTTAVA
jgi:hypothetical protein